MSILTTIEETTKKIENEVSESIFKERKLTFTSFKSNKEKYGVEESYYFSVLARMIEKKVIRTKETQEEYSKMDKEAKGKIKDQGAFVFGTFKEQRRLNNMLIKRSMISLDLDYCPKDIFEIIEDKVFLGEIMFPFVYYTTHSHTAKNPRLRIVIPLLEDITPEQYPPISKYLASLFGLEYFDETTFQSSRIMYFPSASLDGEYRAKYFNHGEKYVNGSEILDKYINDFTDINTYQKVFYINGLNINKFKDNKAPDSTKTPYRIINAFNEEYTITEAIDFFLKEVYEPSSKERYSFIQGETKNGLCILNSQYAFSFHGTDPAQGRLLSAFDIVRIHKFGELDEIDNFNEENGKLKSYEAMKKFIENNLPNVVKRLPIVNKMIQDQKDFLKEVEETTKEDKKTKLEIKINENHQNVEMEVIDLKEKIEILEVNVEVEKSWKSKLQMQGKGDNEKPKTNAYNLDLILEKDIVLNDLFYYDELKQNICFKKAPYWDKTKSFGSSLEDIDMAHIRNYLDRNYQIVKERLIDDSLIVRASKDKRHPIRDFLNSLPKWDGVKRLERVLIDVFDLEDIVFYRESAKKIFCGLIKRVFVPGCKYDYMLILGGRQGIGKSQFLKSLATPYWGKNGMKSIDSQKNYFSDTKIPFNDSKDKYQQLEGIWLYEIAELAGFKKSEIEDIKAFLTKTEDKFRRSYGEKSVEIKRQLIFCGTTNDTKPLRENEDNRRFLFLNSKLPFGTTRVYNEKYWNEELRNNVFAEAIYYLTEENYNPMESFSSEAFQQFIEISENGATENSSLPLVELFVNNKFPIDYINYFSQNSNLEKLRDVWREGSKPLYDPQFTCVRVKREEFSITEMEILLYEKQVSDKSDFMLRLNIKNALMKLGYEETTHKRLFGIIGQQKVWRKIPKKEVEVKQEIKEINEEELPF